jgi:hypothetical protein
MNIYEFFSQRAGLWLSQCTSRNLLTQTAHNQRQQIKVELLAPHQLAISVNHQTTTLTALPLEGGLEGKLILTPGDYEGEFTISPDRVLTITFEMGGVRMEEKLWFPLANLCMRTAWGLNQSYFWTEVRKVS